MTVSCARERGRPGRASGRVFRRVFGRASGTGAWAIPLLALGLAGVGAPVAAQWVGTDSTAAPVPVLLVPGWSDGPEDLEPLESRFLEAGWPLARVMAVEFQDPVGSNRTHARAVAAAVRSLRATTGARRVDIVAHSMGGLAVRRFLAEGETDSTEQDPRVPALETSPDGVATPATVRKVVFLGTPHRGTAAAWLAWGEGGDEMQPGSPFLDTLNAAPFVPDSVEALALWTPLDLRVIPGESAILPEAENTRNAEICCPTHPGLLDHDETFRAVVEFLREGGGGEPAGSGGGSPPRSPGRSPGR